MTTDTLTFFEVGTEPDLYQYFVVDEPGWDIVFDGRPVADHWYAPSVSSFQPRLREGDFWNFGVGAYGACLAVRPEALGETHIGGFLERAGELLPFEYGSRTFSVLNITECIDALDRERTSWVDRSDMDVEEIAGDLADELADAISSAPPKVDTPMFDLERLGWQLFKIPETAITSIYYWERSIDDPRDQFRGVYEAHGLTGLTFTPIYSATCPW